MYPPSPTTTGGKVRPAQASYKTYCNISILRYLYPGNVVCIFHNNEPMSVIIYFNLLSSSLKIQIIYRRITLLLSHNINKKHKRKHSTTYDLIFEEKKYPPKLIISISNKYANGKELDHNSFQGGLNTQHLKN